MTGIDDLEQLLYKARFEEAKKQELMHNRKVPSPCKEGKSASEWTQAKSTSTSPATIHCQNYGGHRHIAKNCTKFRQTAPKESHRRCSSASVGPGNNVAMTTTSDPLLLTPEI